MRQATAAVRPVTCGRQAGWRRGLPSTFEQQTGAATEAVRVAAGRRRTVAAVACVRLGVLGRLRGQRAQGAVLVRAGRRRVVMVMVVVRHDRRRLVALQ